MHKSAGRIEKWAASHRMIPAGQEIYAEGEACDSLFLVCEGWAIQHQILEDGRRQILSFALPGTLLGFQTDAGAGMAHTAECLTDVTVAVIPRSQLPEIFRRDPDLACAFAELATETLNGAYETLTDVGRRTAREAVAHLLLRLFVRMRRMDSAATSPSIDFPLTLEHIGDALGLTGVHVCRTLRSLREDGILHLTRGALRVLDLPRLIKAAGCSVEQLNLRGSGILSEPEARSRDRAPARPRSTWNTMRDEVRLAG